MTGKYDWRIVGLEARLIIDYMSDEEFEKFYSEFRELCSKYDIQMKNITRRANNREG